jgi:Ca2+-binding RTX toxin-like protein
MAAGYAGDAPPSGPVTAVTRFLPARHRRAITPRHHAAIGSTPTITETRQRRQIMSVNYVYGTDGNDTLTGTSAYSNDVLYGRGGDDVLVAGGGYIDTLNGGPGADTFDFNSTSGGAHKIADFHWADGDKIDLSTIDAKEYSFWSSSTWGNQAFTWKGDVTGTWALGRGELGYENWGGSETLIIGNTDGDSHMELQINVTGAIPSLASDFVL